MAKQGVTVELFYDSIWNDHTSDVYTRNSIRISHGKADAYSSAQPASCHLTFDNRDGGMHPRNPNSSLFGKIGRYTPVRVRYEIVSEGFEDASLDITTADGPGSPDWARTQTEAHSGTWSFGAEGVAPGSSEVDITVPAGATSLTFWWRLDDAGAVLVVGVDGETTTLLTDVVDEWTQVTVDVTGISTVSLAAVSSSGTPSFFIDDLTFDDVRFDGEISSWQPRRAVKGDAWTDVRAYGISHKIGQGSIEPLSPMRDYIEREASNVLAYWPIEEGSLAASALGQGDGDPSELQAVVFNNVFPDLFDIGGPLKALGTGALAPWLPGGALDPSVGGFLTMTDDPGTGGYYVEAIVNGDAGDLFPLIFMTEGNGGGTNGDELTFLAHWISNTSGEAGQTGYGVDDGTLSSYLLSGTVVDNDDLGDRQTHHVRLGVNQVNTDEVRFRVWVDGVEASDETFSNEPVTLDGVRAVGVETGGVVGHLAVGTDADGNLSEHVDAAFGKPGQFVDDRMDDVAAQYDGLDVAFAGDTDDVLAVGPRYTEPMLDVMRAAAAVDLGILHDDIVARQLRYRTGRSLYSQDAALTLDWDSGEIAPPLEPDIDDLDLRNRIVVRRRDGGQTSKRDEQSITDNGLVSANHTLNVPGDGNFIEHQAAWRLHLGTSDETRFPRVTIDLDAAPGLTDDVAALRPGDRLDLINLPDDVSVDDVALLIFGWAEDIESHRRKITFNCTPEAPYRVAEVEGGASVGTVGSTSATLNEDLTDAETAVDIDCGAAGAWSHEGTDYDITVNGERMTVTAVGAAAGTFPSETQTLTVTRSVNGVTKTHDNGDAISMAEPAYIGL